MGSKFNYIVAMYYKFNVGKLGKKRAVVYANKYINYLQHNCKYSNQVEINRLCPDVVKDPICVPDFFINMIRNID
jgi:hypothetical protein|tara:strand:+ start:317 stop:541 length:225 start_codon:yes stop_codon:yes gene_type:complete